MSDIKFLKANLNNNVTLIHTDLQVKMKNVILLLISILCLSVLSCSAWFKFSKKLLKIYLRFNYILKINFTSKLTKAKCNKNLKRNDNCSLDLKINFVACIKKKRGYFAAFLYHIILGGCLEIQSLFIFLKLWPS